LFVGAFLIGCIEGVVAEPSDRSELSSQIRPAFQLPGSWVVAYVVVTRKRMKLMERRVSLAAVIRGLGPCS